MCSHNADLIGLCWIPNLSRNIATTERLEKCFRDSSIESKYSFGWDSSTRCVVVTGDTNPNIIIRIDFIDDSGLCHIYNLHESKFKLDYGSHEFSEKSYHVMNIWRDLLRIIDCRSSLAATTLSDLRSSSANCVCNVMDWPIPIDKTIVDDQFILILNEFIRNSEDQSDGIRHTRHVVDKDVFGNETPQSIKNRMDKENRTQAMQSTNAVYMESFISLYSDKIDEVSKYHSLSELRSKRLETISNFNTTSAQIDNLCLSSNSIRITRWGLIVASVAMGLNILSLVLTNI